MIDAADFQPQPGFLATRDRVEKTDLFKAGTALAFAAIGNDHVVKG